MLNASFDQGNTLHACFQGADTLDASLNSTVYIPVVDVYEGPYEATPTQFTQTLSTEGFTMAQDVIIHPIPSNYGLITYNGSILTVS